jgi:uncharacterized RmlC-like cupin family protein
MEMKAGDLLHIPQAVVLWPANMKAAAGNHIFMRTEKPIMAIYLGVASSFIEDSTNLLSVFVKGQQHFVHEKDVYLFKGE